MVVPSTLVKAAGRKSSDPRTSGNLPVMLRPIHVFFYRYVMFGRNRCSLRQFVTGTESVKIQNEQMVAIISLVAHTG